jgi:hypothetical protein
MHYAKFGPGGSLLLSRRTLSPSAPFRFIPAHCDSFPSRRFSLQGLPSRFFQNQAEPPLNFQRSMGHSQGRRQAVTKLHTIRIPRSPLATEQLLHTRRACCNCCRLRGMRGWCGCGCGCGEARVKGLSAPFQDTSRTGLTPLLTAQTCRKRG